ncbi:MAG: AAA family ATPase, partial [Simkaniaceae bacterium]
MFKRFIEKELKKQAEDYPVVSVVGPRQSGKTTLVRHTFPDKPYINLEALDIQELAQTDPRGFLQSYPEGAILDEIQKIGR